MKIFITGATGFVGGAIMKKMCSNGYQVWCMNRKESDDAAIINAGAKPVRCTLETITDEELNEMDVVIHAAALLGKWATYNQYYQTNVAGTKKLVDIAKKKGVKKFIFISSDTVVFSGADLINIDEKYPYPKTKYAYSATKQIAEKVVIAAAVPGIFETICLRPRLVWGIGDNNLLPLLVQAVESNKFMWIGKYNYKTSTTHIYNLVYATELCMAVNAAPNVYFVTDGEAVYLKSFFTQLLATQNLKANFNTIPKWLAKLAAYSIENIWKLLHIKSKPPITAFGVANFSTNVIINDSLLKQTLNYQPVVSIAQGMDELKRHAAASKNNGID
jgi:nucleoside-diphosphate-sugar epimerase